MKRSRIHALAVAVSISGCTEVTVVATVPGSDAGGVGIGSRCVESSECDAGAFCEHQKCEELTGVCTAIPTACSSEESSVCGCNGVTYANECHRRAAGIIGSSMNGACDRDGG